jgi:hypothetical protein
LRSGFESAEATLVHRRTVPFQANRARTAKFPSRLAASAARCSDAGLLRLVALIGGASERRSMWTGVWAFRR